MRPCISTRVVVVVSLLAPVVIPARRADASQAPAASAVPSKQDLPASRKKAPGLTASQQRALKILESVEADLGALSPEMQTTILLQIALDSREIDPTRQLPLLQQALQASLGIHDDRLRDEQESKIVAEMATLDLDAAIVMQNSVDPRVRGEIQQLLVRRDIEQGHLNKALTALSQWDPSSHFPYMLAVDLIAKLPATAPPERQAVFSAAVAAYRREDPSPFESANSMEHLILQSYGAVPPAQVSDAIDLVLARSKDLGAGMQATLYGDRGSVQFGSIHQRTLFKLLPVLQKVDPPKAEALLRENPTTAALLQQYPGGVFSLQSAPKDESQKNISDLVGGATYAKAAGSPVRNDQAYMQAESATDAVVSSAARDYKTALSNAQKLPNQPMDALAVSLCTPRGDALEGIAHEVLAKKDVLATREAVKEMLSASQDLSPLARAHYFAAAAGIMMQMGDFPGAKQYLNAMAKAGDALYQSDAFGDPANLAAKSSWPSAAVWVAASAMGARIDPDSALQQSTSLPDPEIAALANVSIATALLGHAPGPLPIEMRHKDRSDMTFFDIPWPDLPQTARRPKSSETPSP